MNFENSLNARISSEIELGTDLFTKLRLLKKKKIRNDAVMNCPRNIKISSSDFDFFFIDILDLK